ncbi:MAG: serine hydrolase [Flavobacterium sp.]|nr:serine hydrolase [Pedobacter sp.]
MKIQIQKLNILIKASFILLIFILGGFKFVKENKTWNTDLPKKSVSYFNSLLFNNGSQIIPFKNLADLKIVSINLGSAYSVEFDAMLRNYADMKSLDFRNLPYLHIPDQYNTLIIQVTSEALTQRKNIDFILAAEKLHTVVVAGFGNQAALSALDSLRSPVIWNQHEIAATAEFTAQIIFGGETVQGHLTDSISVRFNKGAGYKTDQTRLRYTHPEESGISTLKLNKIDDIVNEAIREHATPSAVVMVIKDGNVIFNKAYGLHTYDGVIPTKVDDIYDLASVTKVAATTMAAMKLYDEQKLDLNAGLGTYLEDVKNTNKENISVKDVLLHQAGFVNLDFYSYLKPLDHQPDSSNLYSVKLSEHYFLRNNYYQDVMWRKMLSSSLPTRGRYVYSDISMYMMKEVIEHQTQQPLDQYVLKEFYSSLGMRTAGFNPIKRFNKNQIVPTEQDNYFRNTLLQGYVQDPGACMANGVAGHAGLFASANDLAILNQMLLNGGTYGGVEYIKPETVKLFTSSQSNVSRRGLGFDRGNGTGYPSTSASAESYGHTGYTGTCVWVDPKEKLIYIFLSNRVYPSASNKLNSMRVRPRIQDAIYEAIAGSKTDFAKAE